MPKKSKQENGQILHAFYPYAHLKVRDGVYYTVLHDKRKSTMIRSDAKNLKDRIFAKQQAIAILNQRVIEHLGINAQDMQQQYARANAFSQTKAGPIPVRFNPNGNVPNLLDIAEEYLTMKRSVVSADFMKHIMSNLKLFLTQDYPVTEYTAIRAMIVKNANSYDHAPSTAKKHHKLLDAFFEWAKKAGYIEINPMDAVQAPRVPQQEVEFPSWDEFNRIVEYYRKGINYKLHHDLREENIRFWTVLAKTGMRIQEAFTLRVEDFTDKGFKIDGKRKFHEEPRIRWFIYSAVPGVKELMEECLKHAQTDGRLWSWKTYATPATNLRDCVRALNMSEQYSPHSLRRLAKWWWEIELGLPAHLCNLLAGHSFAVRNKYHRAPTIEDLEGYMSKA
ncbi:MAG TPA: site-specific integrase [Candidatus Kapabacteria bacterium]|nr:site-specific integrase [Candidatus Kapabacteria bacterium]